MMIDNKTMQQVDELKEKSAKMLQDLEQLNKDVLSAMDEYKSKHEAVVHAREIIAKSNQLLKEIKTQAYEDPKEL